MVDELHLDFSQKKRFKSFISEILRVVRLTGRKAHFFPTFLGHAKFQEFSVFLCICVLSFSPTSQNNLNNSSNLNVRGVMKFCNAGDHSLRYRINPRDKIRVYGLCDSAMFAVPHKLMH